MRWTPTTQLSPRQQPPAGLAITDGDTARGQLLAGPARAIDAGSSRIDAVSAEITRSPNV
jgi:hypothetical protein